MADLDKVVPDHVKDAGHGRARGFAEVAGLHEETEEIVIKHHLTYLRQFFLKFTFTHIEASVHLYSSANWLWN